MSQTFTNWIPRVNRLFRSLILLFPYMIPGSRPSSHRPKSGVHAAPPVAEEGLEEMVTPRDPTPVPEQTIFMQTMDFLLEVKATPVSSHTCVLLWYNL